MGEERVRLVAMVLDVYEDVQRSLTPADLRPLLDSNLTVPQLRLLAVLRFDGALGGQQLARRLGVSMPTVTGMVDRLVARGLVERREAVGDRRVRPVALTAQGDRLLTEIRRGGRLAAEEVLGRLDLEDLRALVRGLAAFAAAAHDGADRPSVLAAEV